MENITEFHDWYKEHIREQKSTEEKWLKGLVEEQTYLNQGLTYTPFSYENFKNFKK